MINRTWADADCLNVWASVLVSTLLTGPWELRDGSLRRVSEVVASEGNEKQRELAKREGKSFTPYAT
jgi:hypothetical protein